MYRSTGQLPATGVPLAQSCADTVAVAAERSRLKWSTLYAWRSQEPQFREAWDTAARRGADALAARFEHALVERAVEGWDEPVFHAGEVVGARKRYSDPLLMFGIRDLRAQRRGEAAPFVARTPKVTVVIQQFGQKQTPPLLPKESNDE